MSNDRFKELSLDPFTELTEEELNQGWFFGGGNLLHRDWPAAQKYKVNS